jgi:Tetracyclin repressor-like, C-terminal domain
MRLLVEHAQEALIAIREFRWAEGDAVAAIQERRRRYRRAFEDLLAGGDRQMRIDSHVGCQRMGDAPCLGDRVVAEAAQPQA